MLLNSFQSRVFPTRRINVNNDDHDNGQTKGALTLTPPIILDTPPKRSTRGREIKIFPPKQMLQALPILI